MQPQSTSPRPRPKQTVIVMMTKFDQRKLKTDLIFYSLYLLVNWMGFILILINLWRYSTPKMFGKSPKGEGALPIQKNYCQLFIFLTVYFGPKFWKNVQKGGIISNLQLAHLYKTSAMKRGGFKGRFDFFLKKHQFCLLHTSLTDGFVPSAPHI